MEYINLVNIKVDDKNLEFEFLYKSKNNDNNEIYFKDQNMKEYFGQITKPENKITYSYNDETCYIEKILFKLPIKQYGKLNIFIKINNTEKELKIRDNKNNLITETNNPYCIFLHKYKIQISFDNIKISKRSFCNKIKYELNKQIYGIKKYHKIFPYRFLKTKKRKWYLFNDRLLYGDDNAEQLFKYINTHYPKFAKKCYFVLDKNSLSINRVKGIGKVLKFGTLKHKIKFLNSRMVISSHSSYLDNCFNPFNIEEMTLYKDIINKKFVFLQHGVVMNDVRQYLNRELTTADLFITSTNDEYNYIKQKDFLYEPNMIACTGLPRFDKLENNIKEKIILISPTWRVLNTDVEFKNMPYFKMFKSLLSNSKLNKMIKENNYIIKFLLHPMFAKYKELFEELENENIKILETSKIKYFELFNECSIFITDYSSIHFDVAFLKKPIIYYQFDKEYFFKKHYQLGYFDYDKQGFGKVVETEEEIMNEIKYYIDNNCNIRDEYKDRIEKTFKYLDHENSKRVFEKIQEIDNGDINYRFNDVH